MPMATMATTKMRQQQKRAQPVAGMELVPTEELELVTVGEPELVTIDGSVLVTDGSVGLDGAILFDLDLPDDPKSMRILKILKITK